MSRDDFSRTNRNRDRGTTPASPKGKPKKKKKFLTKKRVLWSLFLQRRWRFLCAWRLPVYYVERPETAE